MHTIFSTIFYAVSLVSSALFPWANHSAPALGAAPAPAALSTYNLAGAGVAASDTSITIQSLTVKQTGALVTASSLRQGAGDRFYATLEPGSTSKQEIVGCTGVTQNSGGTATLTGCLRGMLPFYPYTASTSYAFSHSGGSQVIFGDAPQLFNDFANYVASSTSAGAADAGGAIKGLVEVASAGEAASNAQTGSGDTSAPLALTSAIASSTRTANTAQVVVASSSSGYIDKSYIGGGTIPGYTMTGTNSATSTFATSSIQIGSFPAYQIGKNVKVLTTSGTSTFSVPSGITALSVQVQGGGGQGSSGSSGTTGGGGGGAGGYAMKIVDVSGTSTVEYHVGGAQEASSFGTPGTSIYFYGLGASSGTGGSASGGDLNMSGVGGGSAFQGADGNGSNASGIGGGGGSSIFGGGGAGNSCQANGVSATGYGSGGGGGGGCTGPTNSSGGNGKQGIIIITW